MRRSVSLVAVFTLLLTLLAFGGTAGAVTTGQGQLNVLHGIPDTPVDVYANGSAVATGFEFEDLQQFDLPAGQYDIEIRPAGAPASDPALLAATIQLPPGGNVTAVAHLDEGGTPTVSAYLNDTSPIADGQARVEVGHTAAAPAVDVRAGGNVLISNLSNNDRGSVDVPAGTYPVDLVPTGTTTVVFGPVNLTVEAGTAYQVHAIGDINAGNFTVAIITIADLGPSTSNGVISVIHGIPGVTVDVYLNGYLALPGFTPGALVGPLTVPAGDYTAAIYPQGADPLATAPVLSGTTSLPQGANATIVAHLPDTSVSSDPVLSVFVNDTSALGAGEARVVVRHTADAPAVDIIANGSVLVPNLANPDAAQADVPAGAYAVEIAPAGGSPVVGPVNLNLEAGTAYLVHATGSLSGGTFDLVIQTISGLGSGGAFPDDDGSVHEPAIDALFKAGIAQGRTDGTFGPNDDVTRGQTAAFVNRALNLPVPSMDFFPDDNGSIFEDDINALAAAGIIQGKADGTFGPNDRLTRAQMASVIARAFNLPAASADYFTDDGGSVHEDAINSLAEAGIAQGVGGGLFAPNDTVTRGQVSSFLARALGFVPLP